MMLGFLPMAASGLKCIGASGLRSGQQGPPDFLDMHIIRAATSTKDIHFWVGGPDIYVLAR
jgi:hypothetical protein